MTLRAKSGGDSIFAPLKFQCGISLRRLRSDDQGNRALAGRQRGLEFFGGCGLPLRNDLRRTDDHAHEKISRFIYFIRII